MYLLREINSLKLIKFLFISAFSFIINNLFNYTLIELIGINEYLSSVYYICNYLYYKLLSMQIFCL